MNIRQALLAAADQIERDPRSYHYVSNRAPSCDTPACMLGWTGHFLGVPALDFDDGSYGSYMYRTAARLGLASMDTFLDRCTVLQEERGRHRTQLWDFSEDAVQVLRLYADRYHPALPASVRAIFTENAHEPA